MAKMETLKCDICKKIFMWEKDDGISVSANIFIQKGEYNLAYDFRHACLDCRKDLISLLKEFLANKQNK